MHIGRLGFDGWTYEWIDSGLDELGPSGSGGGLQSAAPFGLPISMSAFSLFVLSSNMLCRFWFAAAQQRRENMQHESHRYDHLHKYDHMHSIDSHHTRSYFVLDGLTYSCIAGCQQASPHAGDPPSVQCCCFGGTSPGTLGFKQDQTGIYSTQYQKAFFMPTW